MGADGVADPVGDKRFLPAALQLHQPPADLGGAPGTEGLIEGVLFIAKAAADVRLDNPDLAPGNPQSLADDPADNVGDLGGADHHHPARLLVGEAPVVLNVAVLDGRSIIPTLDFDEAGLLPGRFIVPPADVGVGQNVIFIPFLNLRRAVLHRFLDIQDEGQLLILDFDGPDGLRGGDFVLGDDHRHLVSVVTDVPV